VAPLDHPLLTAGLCKVEELVPLSVSKIGKFYSFIGRWKNISNKVDQPPSMLRLDKPFLFQKQFSM
jgi:hypothetical protein